MSLINHLKNIRIVMIGTTLPANIGSAARAMHTMGLTDLVVVKPRLPIDDTSTANAAGGIDVLKNTRIVNDLQDALADCSLILAASARTRHLPRPIINPRNAGQLLNQFFVAHTHQDTPPTIAILFGREDRGLTNEELALADYHIQIPANPDYPVLNVAAAIQVIGAFIYDAFATPTATTDRANTLAINVRQEWDEPAITHAQQQNLEQSLIDLLVQLQLADADDLKHLPNRLARLTSRLQLDQKEFALLRALIAKISGKINT